LRAILWAGLLLYLVAISIVVVRILLEQKQAWIRRVAAVLFAVSVPMIVVSLLTSKSEWVKPRCVVLDEVASVRVAPSHDADAEIEIHEGLVVQTLDADSAWFRVRLPNGVTGWVDATALEKI
jgi:SH3-like domain-containing protein